ATVRRKLARQIVVAERCGTLEIFGSLIDAHATFDSRQYFACLEAENAYCAPGTHLFTVQHCSLRLCSIFEHDQPVFPAKLTDLVHLTGKPPGMHHDERSTLLGKTTLSRCQIETCRAWIDIHKYRHVAKKPHGSHCGPGGVGGYEDLAALWQVECEEHG